MCARGKESEVFQLEHGGQAPGDWTVAAEPHMISRASAIAAGEAILAAHPTAEFLLYDLPLDSADTDSGRPCICSEHTVDLGFSGMPAAFIADRKEEVLTDGVYQKPAFRAGDGPVASFMFGVEGIPATELLEQVLARGAPALQCSPPPAFVQ
jgi:hypothetical protein